MRARLAGRALRVPSSSDRPEQEPGREVGAACLGSTSSRSAERLAHLREVRGQRRLGPGVVPRTGSRRRRRRASQADPCGSAGRRPGRAATRSRLTSALEHASQRARATWTPGRREPGRVVSSAQSYDASGQSAARRSIIRNTTSKSPEVATRVRERPAGEEPEPRASPAGGRIDVDRVERERDLGGGAAGSASRRPRPRRARGGPRVRTQGERAHGDSVAALARRDRPLQGGRSSLIRPSAAPSAAERSLRLARRRPEASIFGGPDAVPAKAPGHDRIGQRRRGGHAHHEADRAEERAAERDRGQGRASGAAQQHHEAPVRIAEREQDRQGRSRSRWRRPRRRRARGASSRLRGSAGRRGRPRAGRRTRRPDREPEAQAAGSLSLPFDLEPELRACRPLPAARRPGTARCDSPAPPPRPRTAGRSRRCCRRPARRRTVPSSITSRSLRMMMNKRTVLGSIHRPKRTSSCVYSRFQANRVTANREHGVGGGQTHGAREKVDLPRAPRPSDTAMRR